MFFGDVHIGNRLSSIGNFKKSVIDKYKDDKDCYFFDMSDGCDMILSQTNDRRFKASMVDQRYLNVDDPVDLQIQDYCDLLAPIAPRLLGVLSCNHHEEILKRSGTDPTKRICYTLWKGKEAESRLLSWENFYAIRFVYAESHEHSRTVTLPMYLNHGITTGTRTEGGHITSIGNVAMNYSGCDIYAFGHNHQLENWDRIILTPCFRSKKPVSRKLIRLNTGTYLKSRSDDHTVSYPEARSFKPNSIGHMEVNVLIDRHGLNIVPIKRMIL